MKNQRKFIMNTIESSNNFFAEYLQNVLMELFIKEIEALEFYQKLNEEERRIYAKFFAYGLCGVIVDWAREGMKKNENELSSLLERMLFNIERIGHEFYIYHKNEQVSKK